MISLLLTLQATPPGWVPPVVAIAAVTMAVCLVVLTVTLVAAAKAVNRLAAKGEALSDKISGEVREILETSRRTRFTFERGIKRARRRLQDLDALIEVVQEEVEETALDASAAMRRVRTAGGAIGLVRRLLVRGRR